MLCVNQRMTVRGTTCPPAQCRSKTSHNVTSALTVIFLTHPRLLGAETQPISLVSCFGGLGKDFAPRYFIVSSLMRLGGERPSVARQEPGGNFGSLPIADGAPSTTAE